MSHIRWELQQAEFIAVGHQGATSFPVAAPKADPVNRCAPGAVRAILQRANDIPKRAASPMPRVGNAVRDSRTGCDTDRAAQGHQHASFPRRAKTYGVNVVSTSVVFPDVRRVPERVN